MTTNTAIAIATLTGSGGMSAASGEQGKYSTLLVYYGFLESP